MPFAVRPAVGPDHHRQRSRRRFGHANCHLHRAQHASHVLIRDFSYDLGRLGSDGVFGRREGTSNVSSLTGCKRAPGRRRGDSHQRKTRGANRVNTILFIILLLVRPVRTWLAREPARRAGTHPASSALSRSPRSLHCVKSALICDRAVTPTGGQWKPTDLDDLQSAAQACCQLGVAVGLREELEEGRNLKSRATPKQSHKDQVMTTDPRGSRGEAQSAWS